MACLDAASVQHTESINTSKQAITNAWINQGKLLTSGPIGNCYLALDATNSDDVAAAPVNHGGQKSCKAQKKHLSNLSRAVSLPLQTAAASVTLREGNGPKIIGLHNMPLN